MGLYNMIPSRVPCEEEEERNREGTNISREKTVSMLLRFLLDPFYIAFVLHRCGIGGLPSLLLLCSPFTFLPGMRAPLLLCLVFLLLVGSLFFSLNHSLVPLYHKKFSRVSMFDHSEVSGIRPPLS